MPAQGVHPMRRLLPLVAVSCLAFAPAPKPKPDQSKNDLKKLQGKWVRVSCFVDGAGYSERPGAVTVKVQGDLMAFGSPGDTWKVTLYARKQPKQIDSQNATRKGRGSLYYGLYRLEGDDLVICWRRDDAKGGRPSGFDPAEPTVMVHTYKRKKP